MSIFRLLALDKLASAIRIIFKNGGITGSLGKLWRFDSVQEGQLMGTDSNGNKYFENRRFMFGRSRWVEYHPSYRWDYDASQVTPDWFGWLHYKTDLVPSEDWAKHCLYCCCWTHCWLLPPSENMSGTDQAYYPYTTTRPKINVWDGSTICNRATCSSK